MDNIRKNSLDEVNLEGWIWKDFLQHAITSLSPLELSSYPIPRNYLDRKSIVGSKLKPLTAHTSTWACCTQKLRQVRAACVQVNSEISVFNFLISPLSRYDLPFFGADFVTLPSGHLLALDFQPALKNDNLHTAYFLERLLPVHKHWQSLLPDGGNIPEEAKRFFSPGFLWTRLPLEEDSNRLIAEVIFPAFSEYIILYINLIRQAKAVSNYRSNLLLDGQKNYMNYRAEKDPARAMLTRFYGKEWTERYIHEVLFDL